MSGKLDQSLDDIVKRGKGNTSSRGGRTSRPAGRKTTAPRVSGGISKPGRGPRTSGKVSAPVAAAPVKSLSSSKILVTGLPTDVSEQQIKEYFTQTIGLVRAVVVTYGANGNSRGIAAITFAGADSAAKAAKNLDGSPVDGRPMKVEVIVSAQQVPKPKGLKERISQVAASAPGKNKPKTAVPARQPVAKTARGGAAKRGGGKSGRKDRAKPKTADELDAEMTDYFVPKEGGGAATNGAPAANGAAAAGDASMDDQIM